MYCMVYVYIFCSFQFSRYSALLVGIAYGSRRNSKSFFSIESELKLKKHLILGNQPSFQKKKHTLKNDLHHHLAVTTEIPLTMSCQESLLFIVRCLEGTSTSVDFNLKSSVQCRLNLVCT